MTDARPDAKPLQPRKTLRPRDAATLIVVDSSSGEPRVLLGRRRLDMVFMPGRYVFPGGRVDPGDRHVAVEDDLEPGNLKNLLVAMKGHPKPRQGPGAGSGSGARDLRGGGPADRQARADGRHLPEPRPGRSSSRTASGRRWRS